MIASRRASVCCSLVSIPACARRKPGITLPGYPIDSGSCCGSRGSCPSRSPMWTIAVCRVRLRHHQSHRAADARHRYAPASEIRGGMEGPGAEDQEVQAVSGRTCRRHGVARDRALLDVDEETRTALRKSPCPGLQPVTVHGARIHVLPNPSGRNANFSYGEMLDAFRALSQYLTAKNARPPRPFRKNPKDFASLASFAVRRLDAS